MSDSLLVQTASHRQTAYNTQLESEGWTPSLDVLMQSSDAVCRKAGLLFPGEEELSGLKVCLG